MLKNLKGSGFHLALLISALCKPSASLTLLKKTPSIFLTNKKSTKFSEQSEMSALNQEALQLC